MIYRFTIISDEVDDFIREIKIDSEATFFDLHEAILKAAGYKDDQMTSFFICDDDWEFFFSSRRRHTSCSRDWSSDVALPIL